jgi:hypothetical protein
MVANGQQACNIGLLIILLVIYVSVIQGDDSLLMDDGNADYHLILQSNAGAY